MTIRRKAALIATSGLAAAAVAACGSSSTSKSTSAPAATTSLGTATPSTTVHLSADPKGALMFDTKTLHTIAGKVTLVMANPSSSGLSHGVGVNGNGVDQDGAIVKAGGTSTDTLTLKRGTYTFYCPVPGHEAAGMKGTLVVT